MKKILSVIIYMSLLLISACDVHEWPETQELVKCNIRIHYETVMTKWEYFYNGTELIEKGLGETYENCLEVGKIRYVVRVYPMSPELRTSQNHTHEFVFTRDVDKGYDHEMTLELLPGDYNVMVWSDFVESNEENHFYNVENFTGIMLRPDYQGSSNYRDAFCGQVNVSLSDDSTSQISHTIDIRMKRPLAKFEILTSDLVEFIETKDSDLDLYKAKIQYIGYMPDTYSLFAGRPVASTTGVMFESPLTRLSELEASIGFDYVFVSEAGTTVTAKIGIYDNKDQLLSVSDPITIPIKPGYHTLLRGSFLMQGTSNGVDIETDWGGDYNIVLK